MGNKKVLHSASTALCRRRSQSHEVGTIVIPAHRGGSRAWGSFSPLLGLRSQMGFSSGSASPTKMSCPGCFQNGSPG